MTTRSKQLLKDFVKEFPKIVNDMKDANHGLKPSENNDIYTTSSYHMEGDVWTHTMMVFKEAITRYPNDYLLHIAVLCHDIGKPYVREVVIDEVKGTRVRFIGHEGVSVFKTIDILKSKIFEPFELTEQDKLMILNTIGLHGDFFESFSNEKSLLKMIHKFNSYELFSLVQKHLICDHNGRISYDEHNSELIETFTKDDYQRYATGLVYPEDYNPPLLTVLVGPPCSGKSTYIAKNLSKALVISRDNTLIKYGKEKFPDLNYSDLFTTLSSSDHEDIDRLVMEQFMLATSNKQDIVIDLTNMSPKSRRKWSQGTKNIITKEYYKQAIVFYTGFEELYKRNTIRAAKEGKFIKEYIMTMMCKNYKVPMYDEYNNIEFVLAN
jgi:predicted kinase